MIKKISISTSKRNEMIDITSRVQDIAKSTDERVITIYSPHTTAAITINEGADPDVQHDILAKLKQLVPKDDGYEHAEGNSDSHIKTALLGPSQQVIVKDGELMLGTWQKIFFCEFDGPRDRNFYVQY